ncbi:MAG: IS4 family transposase, partial [Aestuariibacter sp.]|nr:IS4 family transposase [Aestuariibacter sp.]
MPMTDPSVNVEQPTIFQKLLEPVETFVKEQNQQLHKPRNQKYAYEDFFRLLIFYFASGTVGLKLLVNARLNTGLLAPELGLRAVPYSTCQDAFERFPPRLFQAVFQHLLSSVSFKAVPELAALGTLYCIDGSLFPVISSMLWAEYTTKHQALKLHLCFDLNRMIPVDFWVGSGNSSERNALRTWLAAGVTYIADRGYMSFQLCHEVCQAQAHFVFRTKTNLVLTVVKSLPVVLPAPAQGLFSQLTDELIRYDHDPQRALYRLVRFDIANQAYYLLTDRHDLTTFQIILLYAYRWQIELLFRFLKRTMNGIHLIR